MKEFVVSKFLQTCLGKVADFIDSNDGICDLINLEKTLIYQNNEIR